MSFSKTPIFFNPFNTKGDLFLCATEEKINPIHNIRFICKWTVDFIDCRVCLFQLNFTSLCYFWLQINWTLLNCSREELCCHSFGPDLLCKLLTCATVKGPNERARMGRRDRPRGGALRIHHNLCTPSVSTQTAERVEDAGQAEDRWSRPTSCPDIQHLHLPRLWTNFLLQLRRSFRSVEFVFKVQMKSKPYWFC